MKAPGSIRLGNKRADAPGKPGPGENRRRHRPQKPHPRQSARAPGSNDGAARDDVIERFRAKYEADLKCDGPMSTATEALAERVRKGAWSACAGVG